MLFQDDEKKIFEYQSGAETLYADPLAVSRKILLLTGGDPNRLVEQATAADPATAGPEALFAASSAADRLLAAVREAFDLPPFDRTTGQGATEGHVLGVWQAFCAFLQKKSPPPASAPTSPVPTESPSPSPSATPCTSG